jgi:hypothetical protein
MKKAETKLTSVKIISDLYQTFRVASVSEHGITLQKLVNRSINLYLNDENYKNKLNNYNKLQISGSAF